jgi:phage FluMu protein gp41
MGLNVNGKLIKKGVMRLATAGDELSVAQHPHVKNNPDYIALVLLSRVIVRLDKVDSEITPSLLEQLKTADFTFLQNMYSTINEGDAMKIRICCPECKKEFVEPINFT